MDFTWEELTPEERRQAYADWEAGKGLIGGDPRLRPQSHLLPQWGVNQPFFRALALDDDRGNNGERLHAAIGSDQPLEIEIGFGRGDFLLDRALRHPDRLFIGYETKTKATRLMLRRIERANQLNPAATPPVRDNSALGRQARAGQAGAHDQMLTNLWLSDDDARFNLPRVIPDRRVHMLHILFPDPWWKAQHKVKRLFSPPFVDLIAAKIQPGGILHFKSDVEEYGELVRHLVESHGAFGPTDPELSALIGDYALTHREHWCQVHGKPVWAYYFARV